MQTFDIVSKKYIVLGEVDSIRLFLIISTVFLRIKSRMIQQEHNVIGVTDRADTK